MLITTECVIADEPMDDPVPPMGGGMGNVVEPEQTPNADGGIGEESSSVSAGSPEVTESDEEFGDESFSAGERENIIGIGLGFSSYDQGGSTVNTITIPFSYSWNFGGESKPSLTLRLPISQIDVDGNDAAVSSAVEPKSRSSTFLGFSFCPSLFPLLIMMKLTVTL